MRRYLGPILWISSLQYFVVQYLAAYAWQTRFSWQENPISDLGNTSCAEYSNRFVCSPQHDLMNFSFVLLGLTMIFGSVLIAQQYPRKQRLGFYLLVLAGFGTILVGMFPENTIAGLHTLGAAMPFLLGNVALIVLGTTLKLPKALRLYTLASGAVALAALVFYLSHQYFGLGQGGMERLVAYPQTIWMIIFGITKCTASAPK